jgi:uncharacterized protein YbjT (DUF2867 family)
MTSSSHAAGRVFLIGATGGVGQHVLRLLRDQNHPVSGLHREPSQATAIEATGATAVHGDLVNDSAQTLATAMQGHDAVVFTAGAGGNPDMVTAVDERGAMKAADAADLAGAGRFVLVSVFMDAWRGEKSPGPGFEQYRDAKRAADVHLSGTDLDWLIIRPGTLTDDPGTERVNAGVAITYGSIPRADVAAVIAHVVFAPSLNRLAIEITTGAQTIEGALSRLKSEPWQPGL